MNGLQGKTAIITGASSGIGLAIAKELAGEGVNVVLAARRAEKLEELASEINQMGTAKALAVQTDMTNKADVEQLVQKAKAAFEHVDIFVNNAGQMLSATVRSGKVEEWERAND
ncbi:hypothetical protein Bbad01_28760 [Bacillus badius]|nr:hypothetical protein Bbad01_28760 [Bacillus badius]